MNLNTDIPLVGCLANDTENLFTGGIENSSEEIRKVTGITGTAGTCVYLVACLHGVNMSGGEKRREKQRKKDLACPFITVCLPTNQRA